jgi:hypothetical protein
MLNDASSPLPNVFIIAWSLEGKSYPLDTEYSAVADIDHKKQNTIIVNIGAIHLPLCEVRNMLIL